LGTFTAGTEKATFAYFALVPAFAYLAFVAAERSLFENLTLVVGVASD